MENSKIYLIIFITVMAFTTQAQENSFDASLTASQQFIKEDSGIAFEGVLGYYFSNAFKMEINFGSARLDSKELNRKYDLLHLGIHGNYSIIQLEKSRLESIFGFSYLIYEDDDIIEDDQGLGFDFGIQTVFATHKSLNYGLRVVTSYNRIAPGGIINAGLFLRVQL